MHLCPSAGVSNLDLILFAFMLQWSLMVVVVVVCLISVVLFSREREYPGSILLDAQKTREGEGGENGDGREREEKREKI